MFLGRNRAEGGMSVVLNGDEMGILSKRVSGQVRAPASGYSLFDSQLTVTGDIETVGSVRVDGRMVGSVRRADTVVIGVGASMEGDVIAREVIVGGTLVGNIHAFERVELQPTAIVSGDLSAQVVLIQEGGVVNGRVEMRQQSNGAFPADLTAGHMLPSGQR